MINKDCKQCEGSGTIIKTYLVEASIGDYDYEEVLCPECSNSKEKTKNNYDTKKDESN